MYRSLTAGKVELAAALERAIADRFDLNEVSLTPIRSGPLSIAWKCQGSYSSESVVWCVKGHRTKKIVTIESESEFTALWQAHVGELIPKTIPASDGSLWFSLGDKYFSAHEFVSSDEPFDWTQSAWSASQTRAAAGGLATFHTGAETVRAAMGANSLRFAGSVMPRVGRVFSTAITSVTDELRREDPLLNSIPSKVLLAEFSQLLLDLESKPSNLRLVHGDFHPGNLLFRGDQLAAILDLEDVHYEDVLFDVGYGALSFAGRWGRIDEQVNSGGFLDGELMSAFLAGYNELAFKSEHASIDRPLTEADIARHLRLAGFLVLQWLLEMYVKEPGARPGLSNPLRDCLTFLRGAP